MVLDVMTVMSVGWGELNDVWPWSRVRKAHEKVLEARFYSAYPTASLHSTFIASKAGAKHRGKTPRPVDLLLPGAAPSSVLRHEGRGGEVVYSPAVVAAFTLARELGFTSSAHLAVFDTTKLRASGWGR